MIQEMLDEAEAVETQILQYSKWRSSYTNHVAFVVEGQDDYMYYSNMLKSVFGGRALDKIAPYCANGRRYVLALWRELQNNAQEQQKKSLFFVDRDFTPPTESGDNLYITPGYSYENSLFDINYLQRILKSELKCNDEDAAAEISHILATFQSNIIQIQTDPTLLKINHILYGYTIKNIPKEQKIKEIDENIKIAPNGMVQLLMSDQQIKTLLGIEHNIPEELLEETKASFNQLQPITNWRGKFLLPFLLVYLRSLVTDRSKRKNRMIFKKRKSMVGITINISTLIAAADCPSCLEFFYKSHTNYFEA